MNIIVVKADQDLGHQRIDIPHTDRDLDHLEKEDMKEVDVSKQSYKKLKNFQQETKNTKQRTQNKKQKPSKKLGLNINI